MSTNSHMGQPASHHVLLEAVGVADTGDSRKDLEFFRTLPDCKVSPTGPTGFRVPKGKVLIITDVDWQYGSGQAGGSQTFRVFIESLSEPDLQRRVFESTTHLDKSGNGGTSESMTTGFVVSRKVRLAVDTFPGGGKIQHVLLRGYLALDK